MSSVSIAATRLLGRMLPTTAFGCLLVVAWFVLF